MAKLIIQRSSEYINRIRDIRIRVDGHQIGTVANGKELHLDLPAGAHTVQAKIDWAGSREFKVELQEGFEKRVHLSGFKYSRYIGYTVPAVVVLALIPYPFIPFTPRLCILVPVFLYFLYYVTIGRHDYLQLRESEETVRQA